MSLAMFHPVTWLLVAQGLCITACAFYQGLGAHLVLGTLVQGASLATIYPFLEGWAKGFVASRPNLDGSAAVKLAADAWSLVRHTAKTVVIWGLWSPDFDVLVPWSPPSRLNPAPYTWAQTWVIILYYTCICDWFCDYYLYTRSCRLAKIRPKDYNVMLAHHAVTTFLMGGSAFVGYFAIGTSVLYLHEWTDIFISLVKIFRTTKSPYLVPLFSINLFVWFGTRIVWFVYSLILPAFSVTDSSFLQFMAWNLVALWAMHLYWFGLMTWLAVSLTRKSSSEVTKMYER